MVKCVERRRDAGLALGGTESELEELVLRRAGSRGRHAGGKDREGVVRGAAGGGEERAGGLFIERADAGGALGVAAREELVVRRGRMLRHDTIICANHLDGHHEGKDRGGVVLGVAVGGEERAGGLFIERADAGGALGVAAREELVVRRGRMLRHLYGHHEVGNGHWVVRGCDLWECVGEGLVVSGLGRERRLGEEGRRGLGSVWVLDLCL